MCKDKLSKICFPAWLFILLSVIYNERMLYFWTSEGFETELLQIDLFALGLGGLLALLVSLIPGPRASKYAAVALALAVNVLYLLFFCVWDVYGTFMTPATILAGAGGVATNFLGEALEEIRKSWWRIGLILLPTVLYALLCRSAQVRWRLRACLAALAAAGYLLGFGAVTYLNEDTESLSAKYEFNGAVNKFGLSMSLILDLINTSNSDTVDPNLTTPSAFPTNPNAASTDESSETEPAAIVYEDNVFSNVDFAALAEETDNSSIATIYSYVDSLTPSSQNAYTGLFEGKNLIFITAESFTAEVIDPELTPTLYRLATQGIQFTEYYQPLWGASTISGEFSNLAGLVPTNGGDCMQEAVQQNLFLMMGKQLNALGYYSVAYHDSDYSFYNRNTTHTHLGYDQFLGRYGGLDGLTGVWPESDLEMIDITVPQYIDQQPFSIYYITVSGHCMYSLNGNAMSRKNYDLVADLECSEAVKCYLAAQLELEAALESLVAQLEEAGIADDTVIVISPDHCPYSLESSDTGSYKNDLCELYGVESYDKIYRDHSALIIWSGCIEGENIVVDEPVYSLDILPTLSNLFGVEYDSRLLVGRDVFSDEIALALWPDYSWVTSLGQYNAQTRTFTLTEEDEELSQEYIQEYTAYISELVSSKIAYSRSVLNTDFFNYLAEAMGLEAE